LKYKKKKILCFVKCYLPGYKYGGPIRTISNFVENFGDKFDIKIVCDDRDFLDTKSYKKVQINGWNKVGKAQVFYLSLRKLNFNSIKNLLKEFNYDLLYLNSFFTFKYSILPIFLLWIKVLPQLPCIIAPRGEFSSGALKIKKLKKFIFINTVKALGIYKNLYWQASSKFEKRDITNNLGKIPKKIYIAPNLVSSIVIEKKKIKKKLKGLLKVLFFSRISPMKNLDFFLNVVNKVSSNIQLDIHGIKEDFRYVNQCKKLINKLPKNIKVSFKNKVDHNKIGTIFKNYDLFVLPTRGENFGHVIYEALASGLPAFISDKTPWKEKNTGGLKVIPLKESLWVTQIEKWSKLSSISLYKKKIMAINYVKKYNLQDKSINKNYNLIKNAIKKI
jgi:glycosyltransferase involved in cell wall biosynthesis